MPIYSIVNELPSGAGLLDAEFQFQESVAVTNDIVIKYELAEMSDEIKPGKLYVAKSNHSLKYTVINPAGEKVSGIITEDDIPSLFKAMADKPFALSQLKESIMRILDVTADRGHTVCIHVGISLAGNGRFLISDGFGPCQAVVARLTNGEFAVYHASDYFGDSDGFKKFVNSIKGLAQDVYVFQKSIPIANLKKGPLLALELSNSLGMEVKRVHVDGYSAIIADAKNNKVILAGEIKYLDTKEEYVEKKDAVSKVIDMRQAISIEQSIQDAIKFKREHVGIGYSLPKTFLSFERVEKKVVEATPPKVQLDVKDQSERKIEKRDEDKDEKLEKELKELKTALTTHFNRLSQLKLTDSIKYSFTDIPPGPKKAVLQLCLKFLDQEPDVAAFQAELAKQSKYSAKGEGETASLVNKTIEVLKKMSVYSHKATKKIN